MNSQALWRDVREVKPFAVDAARDRPLWRISTAPGKGHEIANLITPAAQMFYDWAGGLVWVAMPIPDEPDAASIRGAVAQVGGHATLIRAPASVRAAVDVFEPEAPGVAALEQAGEGELRSQGRAQSRPHVGGGVMMADAQPLDFSRAQCGVKRCIADPGSSRALNRSRVCSASLRAALRPGHGAKACKPTSPSPSSPTRRPQFGENPARLRALRLLHRHLPDLCAARRRTRFTARPHLPDQGNAGAGQAGDALTWSSISTAASPACPA